MSTHLENKTGRAQPINLFNYYNPWIKPGEVPEYEKKKPESQNYKLKKIYKRRSE